MRKTLLAILPFIIGAVSACVSTQAKGSDKPALAVPVPPPHEIAIPAEPLEPVGEIPDSSPPGASPAPRSNRPAAPRPATTEKPEPKSDKPDQPAQPAPTTPEPAPPLPPAAAPQLKTPQTADTSAAVKNVRTTMDRAKNTLHAVNKDSLSKERQKAYKDAELFLQQAEDALKDGNVIFAQAVATKAETLAHELAGR
jgi:outer membrane biosynthesis protein TonB